MYIQKRFGGSLCALAFSLIFSVGLAGCGGGGGSSPSPTPAPTPTPTPQPLTYTVSAQVGEGTAIAPSSVAVESGKTASLTVTLLSGYASGVFDGCGAHVSITAPGSTSFTTTAIAGNCTITSSATKPTLAYKVSFTADGGTVRNFEGTTDITATGVTVAPGVPLEVLLAPDMAHVNTWGPSVTLSGACTGSQVSTFVYRVVPVGDCSASVSYKKIDSDHDGKADTDDPALHLQWVDVQPHVVRNADVSAKKAQVTFTAYLTGNMGKHDDGSLAKVANVKLRTNFTSVGTSVSSGVEEVTLYDDGTHGDTKAGDGIYTAVMTPLGIVTSSTMVFDNSKAVSTYGGKVIEVNNLLAFYDASGAKLTPVNTQSVEGQGSPVLVLDDSVPQVAVTKVADNIYKSGRFLVLVDPTYAQHDDSQWAGHLASRYASGPFDFFTKWNMGRSFGLNWSYFNSVRHYADGIGLSAKEDSSANYGLPGICGVIDMGSIHLAAHGFNHEVNHCWSAYYDKSEMKLTHGDGHWSASSTVLGPVTTSPSLVASGASWKVEWPQAFPSNRVMSMLDLYNAGLATIGEVPSMYYVDEALWNAQDHLGELVPAQYLHQMTSADLVRVYGTRSAGYSGVKNFRMLSLVLGGAPLTEAEAAYMELMLAHVSGTSDGDTVNNTYAPSFAKVCQGRCTFSTDIK